MSTSPGKKGCDPRGVRLDGLENHFRQIVLDLAPPVRVRLEYCLHPGLVADKHERPRPVGLYGERTEGCSGGRLRLCRPVGFGPLLGEYVPGVPLGMENGIGRCEHEIDGVIVDLYRLHVAGRAALDLGARAAHPVQRKQDVVGGEVFAVMELDALAQMEAPLERIDDFPPLGQTGNDFEVFVALGQALHHVAQSAEGETLIESVGIESVEIALESVSKGLGRSGRSTEDKRKHAGYRDQSTVHGDPSPMTGFRSQPKNTGRSRRGRSSHPDEIPYTLTRTGPRSRAYAPTRTGHGRRVAAQPAHFLPRPKPRSAGATE